jgi:hypothetical protein
MSDKAKTFKGAVAWLAATLGLVLTVYAVLRLYLPTGIAQLLLPLLFGLIVAGILVWMKKVTWQQIAPIGILLAVGLILLHLVLSRPAIVVGAVVDGTSTPVAGLNIVLTDSNGVDHKAITDEDGAFEIRSVPEGKYTVKALNKPLHSGRVTSGLRRIFGMKHDAGELVFGSSPSPTPTQTPSPKPSEMPTATNTPIPEPTSSPTPTNTPIPEPTPSPTSANTSTPTLTPTPTLTASPTLTSTSTTTPTHTPTPTSTPKPCYDKWRMSCTLDDTVFYQGRPSFRCIAHTKPDQFGHGGTVGILLASGAPVDLSSALSMTIQVYDTQGHNTLELRLVDRDGCASNANWSEMQSVHNTWTQISWSLAEFTHLDPEFSVRGCSVFDNRRVRSIELYVRGCSVFDNRRVRSIELYEWNDGTYYFADINWH